MNFLNNIKNISSFNIEAKKFEMKKENHRLFLKSIQKLEDSIHSLIIQISPSENLIKNDYFLKILYENFYKISYPETEKSLKYVQEHDSNWFTGVSPKMIDSIFSGVK